MNQTNHEQLCPCGSGVIYASCCEPYHKEKIIPESALKLMRSRYCAYALNLPEYIVQTTHLASPLYQDNLFAWKRSISKFSKTYTFDKLDIIDSKESTRFAAVIFRAHISVDGQDNTFCEKSYFEKIEGRWFYMWGQLIEGHKPHFTPIGQLELLPLAYYGEPVLREHAKPIEHISHEIRELVEGMKETMMACNGRGLAAPQVHHAIRLFIIRRQIEENNHVEMGEVMVFINPKIIATSTECWSAPEGCLSIPSIHAHVERPTTLTIEYTNLQGETVVEQCSGWQARVILHENDHINGTLFIDRLDKEQREALKPALKSLKSRLSRYYS